MVRALARKRHLSPEGEEPAAGEPAVAEPAAAVAAAEVREPAPEADVWTVVPDDAAGRAERRRGLLAGLPVDGAFTDAQMRALGDADIELLDRRLRALPVDGPFAPDDVVYLAGLDLDALARRLSGAPVEALFSPEHAVIVASHLQTPEPEVPASIDPPLTPEEYASLVVHAAVDAENA
ncbi:hypothetical protein [Brachybacterium sp. UNK5269]|uniref:hypothetical protein n=1 Tax=Brachybacterium sp. UNK5269 TaxID=3408576 RepID=UPI003BB0AB7C